MEEIKLLVEYIVDPTRGQLCGTAGKAIACNDSPIECPIQCKMVKQFFYKDA